MIRNPDHVTVVVSDRAAAVEFFALLDFEADKTVTIDGGRPAEFMGQPTMRAEHVTLVLRGAEPRFEIQLLVYERPEVDIDAEVTNLHRTGYNHLALRTDDLEATASKLRAGGVRMLNECMHFNSRNLQFFEGPGGITLELVEWVEPA